MNMPPIVIVMTTYIPEGGGKRLYVGMAARQSWESFIHYRGMVRLHVADDGSKIVDSNISFDYRPVSFSRQERHGVGASLNAGFRAAFEEYHTDLVLYAVDDWSLTTDIDLNPWAKLLLDRSDVGMVRLGPPHPDTTGVVKAWTNDWQSWGMKLDRHHYAFGHRPALYHKRMIDHYGWFKEDCNAYECERDYNERFCADPQGPDIVLALPHPWFHLDSIELAGIEPQG